MSITFEDFVNHSSLGPYGDNVEEMDYSIGQIVRSLKDNGVYDNTMIYFTSDNGPFLERYFQHKSRHAKQLIIARQRI